MCPRISGSGKVPEGSGRVPGAYWGECWDYLFVCVFCFGMLNLHGAEGYANTAHEHAER